MAVEKGLELNPKYAVLIEQYGDLLFQNGEVEAAIVQWKKALEYNENSASLKQKIANRSL